MDSWLARSRSASDPDVVNTNTTVARRYPSERSSRRNSIPFMRGILRSKRTRCGFVIRRVGCWPRSIRKAVTPSSAITIGQSMACLRMLRTTASAATSSSSTTRRLNAAASVMCLPPLNSRPPNVESRAPHPLGRFDRYPAAMRFDQALAQCEANPGMVVRTGRQLLEHPEYPLLIGGGNAGAVVRYGQFAVAADVLRPYVDVAGRSVVMLDGVADEIAQHALERRLVRHKRLRVDLNRDIEGARPRQNVQNTIDERTQVDGHRIAGRRSGVSIGEQIIDHATEALNTVHDPPQVASNLLARAVAQIFDDPGHEVGDAPQRRLQIMGSRVGEFLQIRVGLTQLQLHGTAPRNVGYRRQHQSAVVGRHGVEANLDGKLRSVLAPRGQIAVHSHLAHCRSGGECLPECPGGRTKPLREQHFQRVADQFGPL